MSNGVGNLVGMGNDSENIQINEHRENFKTKQFCIKRNKSFTLLLATKHL